jgi:argininosuccinate synthase
VVAFAADLGQGEELAGLREKGLASGADQVFIRDLRREFAGIAILAAEKVIHETLDKQKHLQIIEATLKESGLGKKVN